MNITEHIIYEDDDILVCYKPAGVAVQTKRMGEQDMESLLRNYLAGKGEKPYIGIVHRLDQPVEGVMVFAKTAKAAAALNRQMQESGFGKYYYAVTSTVPKEKKGTLVDYLCKDGRSNTSSVVTKQTPGAKCARLEYEVVAELGADGGTGRRALVCVHLLTGRHHQIRVQLAHAGCPLVGDRKYNRQENQTETGLALCSYHIAFEHPESKKKLTYEITPRGKSFHSFPIFR